MKTINYSRLSFLFVSFFGLQVSFAQNTFPNSGNVGIGTTNIPSAYQLAVGGKVICEELKVQLAQNWPITSSKKTINYRHWTK